MRWIAAHLLVIGVITGGRCAYSGIWTTTLASAALAVGAIALLRGRTWGALFTLAVGASFATAAALSMTNAPALFTAIAIAASLPAVVLARPMWCFDRAAMIAAVLGSIVWGASSAAIVRASPDAVMTLGRAEARWDLAQGRAVMRFCADPQGDGYYERRLEHTLGVGSEHVSCGESAIADAWNAGYDEVVREHVEARCGEGALDSALWSRARCL